MNNEIIACLEQVLAPRPLSLPAGRPYSGGRGIAALPFRVACDCEFVTLADYLDVPLYSADRRLVERFPRRARLL